MNIITKKLISLMLATGICSAQGINLKINTPSDGNGSICSMNPDPCLPLNNTAFKSNGIGLWTSYINELAWVSITTGNPQCTNIQGLLGAALVGPSVITVPIVMDTYRIVYYYNGVLVCNSLANHYPITTQQLVSVPAGTIFNIQVVGIDFNNQLIVSNPQRIILSN